MPEGLLIYATVLSDVLQRLVAATNPDIAKSNTNSDEQQQQQPLLRVSVLGDVTYGACCVDDLGARALGCDLLVHYGHSCLVPIQHTVVPCLYVFVEITIDVPHLVECFHQTILQQYLNEHRVVGSRKPHVYLLGTIQFRHALMEARRLLRNPPYEYDLSIPQAKPLSPGEVLGCTSPVLANNNDDPTIPGSSSNSNNNNNNAVVLFVADGRFHLESTMISNPHISKFYRYDPYPKSLTEESYDHVKMKSIRYSAIEAARSAIRAKQQQSQQSQQKSKQPAVFGIILGTLGRQGNPALLTKVRAELTKHKLRSFVVLASEITPSKLALFRTKVDAWVQIACPRLSVDWGHFLSPTAPVLNPYELFCTLDATNKTWRGGTDRSYPMDYYSQDGGPWSNYGDADNKSRQFTTQ
jgi:2-(3-amino-3-carboxypropyl)histidine synthase